MANPERILIFDALRTVLLGGSSPLLYDLRTSLVVRVMAMVILLSYLIPVLT